MALSYNFVVFGAKDDFYKISYRNVNKTPCTRYISENIDTDNKILNSLYKMHCSQTANKFVRLPFKSVWNKHYFKKQFEKDAPICFLFFSNNISKFDHGFDKYLRCCSF